MPYQSTINQEIKAVPVNVKLNSKVVTAAHVTPGIYELNGEDLTLTRTFHGALPIGRLSLSVTSDFGEDLFRQQSSLLASLTRLLHDIRGNTDVYVRVISHDTRKAIIDIAVGDKYLDHYTTDAQQWRVRPCHDVTSRSML